jgi:hypothetical protein
MKASSGAELLAKAKKGDLLLKTSATQGDIGGFDKGRYAVAYLKPHVLHRACGNNGGDLADAGLHDNLTKHLVRDNLLHGARQFVANRLFHKRGTVLFDHRLRNRDLPICIFDLPLLKNLFTARPSSKSRRADGDRRAEGWSYSLSANL